MKILSIGNSFSQDAQRYLHEIAKKDGTDLQVVNLFIGGCSLRTHYLNILGDKIAYELGYNGQNTGIKVAIKQVLESVEWDVVTLQQASAFSANFETYFPYMAEIEKYVKIYCPHAKIFIHETWAYEDGCERLHSLRFNNAKEMLSNIQESYKKAKDVIKADGIIPCGTAMMKALDLGLGKAYRDTYHASLGAGRYLLALTWYKTFTGKDISQNDFDAFDEVVTETERKIVIKAVDSI